MMEHSYITFFCTTFISFNECKSECCVEWISIDCDVTTMAWQAGKRNWTKAASIIVSRSTKAKRNRHCSEMTILVVCLHCQSLSHQYDH